MSFKKWLALGVALFPVQAFAATAAQNSNPEQPFLNVDAINQLDGVNVNPNTAAPGNFSTLNVTTGVTTQGTVFASSLTGNPVGLISKLNTPVGALNLGPQGQVILPGSAARTIFPASITVEAVGGNTATCTGVKVVCQPSGNLLATIAAAQLTSGVPSNGYSASVTAGPALGQGCALGDSIFISANGGGGCATSTSYNSVLTYTVQ